MSKLIYVCTRNTEDCSRLVKAIMSACAAISPDNIAPRSAKIVENGGIAFGLTNPSVTVRINGQSIVLGHTDDPSDRWSIAGSEVPDGNFAIFRADKDSVELISDIVGSRTIWYYKDEKIFIASTSQRAIVLILGSYQFDDRVVPWMLSTGMLGPSFSWDRRVTCVPVDSLVRLGHSNWTLSINSKPIHFNCLDLPDSRHEELLENAFEETFGALNIDFSTWVLPLSGGYDSRAIRCYLLKNRASEKKLRCVTWGLGSSLAEKGTDAYVAKTLASRLNVPHSYYHTDMSVDSAKRIVDRFLLNGEGRIDHLAGYMDGFQIWKTLFEDGVHGIFRGDEGFGRAPVSSPDAVLRLVGLKLCSNFSNLRNCEAFQLPDQHIPPYLQRMSGESLSTWRDRLYHEYRIPVYLAALSDLKLSYVEQMNPLLSRKILTVFRCLPDHLRTDKSLFKRIVARIGPKVEIASAGGDASPESILRQRSIVEILQSEIDSERARSLVPSRLIMQVIQNLQVSDGPATRHRHSFRSKFKELVPSFAKDFLRKKGVMPSLDSNVLGFRIYLISQMNAVLSADAHRAGGNSLTISGPSGRQAMNTDQDTFVLLDAAVPEQRAQWVSLWHMWPTQDAVAHPGYVELFARAGDRVVCACQMGLESGILFPLIVRPLCSEPWARGEGESCDLVSPYGYGGAFGWGPYNVEEYWAGFERWVQTIRAVSLFTRFSLFKDHLIPFFGDTLVKGPCVIVSLEKPADMFLRSYDKAARENVRQAERAGVTLEPDPECRRLEEFLTVYYSTMNRLGALPMYYFQKLFFERLIAQLPNQVMLFHALHNQHIVSTELLLISTDHLYAFLGGTLEEGLRLRANPLLRHGVNLWGKAQGKQQLVLGGGYSGEDSLLRFKQRYAPNGSVSFNVGAKIFDSYSYQTLIDKRVAWESEQGNQWSPAVGFFPAYRG